MSRESNDGFVCPKCEETIQHEQCSCDESLNDVLGQDLFQATLAACFEHYACEHLNRRINLSTAMVACLDCGEDLLDLNPLLSDSLRVARNLP